MLSVGEESMRGKAGVSLSKIYQAANILTAGTPSLKTVALIVTLRPPITTIVPYTKIFDPDETPSSSASSNPDPSCLTLGQQL